MIRERSKADRTWWSLQPLAVTEPQAEDVPAEWSTNPVDRYIFAQLQASKLRPNPRADRRTLIRRVTYDLTGLPPTPEEIDAFLRDDSANAYEILVDRLLASPRYGEHWGRHWLDVTRFGESTGFEVNHVVDNAWPFRDYVIRSLNEDKPFDRFVMEHLAGDAVAPGDPGGRSRAYFSCLRSAGHCWKCRCGTGGADTRRYGGRNHPRHERSISRADDRLRPLSRSQIRSGFAAGLLPPLRHLCRRLSRRPSCRTQETAARTKTEAGRIGSKEKTGSREKDRGGENIRRTPSNRELRQATCRIGQTDCRAAQLSITARGPLRAT